MKRLLPALLLLSLLSTTLLALPAHAQGAPFDIIDAIFKELSTKLKKPLDRTTTDWTYSEKVYPSSSLGCPSWPIQAQVYTLSFSRIAASGGQAVPFLTWQGYRIASITPLRDNSGIVVSLITSAADMVKRLNSNSPAASAIQRMPRLETLLIPFNKSVPQRIAFAGQVALSNGSFAARAANGTQAQQVNSQQCPGAPPSRLISGQLAAVTPGDANALKNKPAGDNIGTIPGGAPLTVVSGPACTPNGIAWWKVQYKTFTGWTAEGQGTTYFLEP